MNMTTLAAFGDILGILPLEIWQRCIAEACQGDNYMASLLSFTMVSTKWRQFLIETPTLWTTIHINDGDEDSLATISLFLYLSRTAKLSLNIWVPISKDWTRIYPLIFHRREQIRDIILLANTESHFTDCKSRISISDVTFEHNLRDIFKTLDFPTSIEYLDVISDRQIKMSDDWIWAPPSLVSAGRWIYSSSILQSSSHSKLRRLSMDSSNLVALLPCLSRLRQLQHLQIYSEEQGYILAPLPLPVTYDVGPLDMPSLHTFQYHGRIHWATMQLLIGAAQTLHNLDLQTGILDLNLILEALFVIKSLRRLSLTLLRLEYDLYDSNKRRLYLPANITNQISEIVVPKEQLHLLEDFRCEMKPLGGIQLSGTIDTDPLWRLFHAIFPALRVLIWNLPIRAHPLLLLLTGQKQLRHFESSMVLVLPSSPLTGLVLPLLESLLIKDAQIASGMTAPNLLHLSTMHREKFVRFNAFPFTWLHSLKLILGEWVEVLGDMGPRDFPLLKALSFTFLGPRCNFPLLELPSLVEISISTKSPTFTQGMKFCNSILCEPWRCPRLEQIDLDSFLEWDLVYLMLEGRNFIRDMPVSCIKRLILPLLPPKFYHIFASLLAGRPAPSFSSFWSLMRRLSVQGAQYRLLDHNLVGCFNCIYWGLDGCHKPIYDSMLFEEYYINDGDDRVLNDIIEPLGLIPLYGYDVTLPMLRIYGAYQGAWITERVERAERWKKQAYAWSKLRYRPLTCHRWCCNPKVMVTEHDIQDDEDSNLVSLPGFFDIVENDAFCNNIVSAIRSIADLLRDRDRKSRFTSASVLTELKVHSKFGNITGAVPSPNTPLQNQPSRARTNTTSTIEYAEFRTALEDALPSLFTEFKDSGLEVGSTIASALTKMVRYAGLRDASKGVILSLIGMIKARDSNIVSTTASVLANLVEHAEFQNEIGNAIPSLVGLLEHSFHTVRSSAGFALGKLGEYDNIRAVIGDIIPSLIELLKHPHSSTRSEALSVLSTLSEHSEFRHRVGLAIPCIVELLNDIGSDTRSNAISTLAELGERGEFHKSIELAILSLVDQLKDANSYTRSSALSALSTLAQHDVFFKAIKATIPFLVEIIQGVDFNARYSAASALSRLVEQAEFRGSIEAVIPSLIEQLTDEDPDIGATALSLLVILAEHAKFRNAIEAALPFLVELLAGVDPRVRHSVGYALTKLAEQGVRLRGVVLRMMSVGWGQGRNVSAMVV